MRLGVIGGTGLVNLDLKQQLGERGKVLRQDDVNVDTAYGSVPLRLCTVQIEGEDHEVVFLQRHHNPSGHGCPPHMINHRANLRAMEGANVDAVLSVCSVGAVVASFPPGKVARTRNTSISPVSPPRFTTTRPCLPLQRCRLTLP